MAPPPPLVDLIALVRETAARIDTREGAVLEAHAGLLSAYRDMTRALHLVAQALPQEERPALDELVDARDRQILSALARGVPRTRLVAHTGFPRREVDARLKRLNDVAGAQNMFTLADTARALGWIDVPPAFVQHGERSA